jgi:hypothetical protein
LDGQFGLSFTHYQKLENIILLMEWVLDNDGTYHWLGEELGQPLCLVFLPDQKLREL